MEILTNRDEIRAWAVENRKAGHSIGFVPTMGALHAGHLELLRTSQTQTDRTVVSIFVNPSQFGPAEDFNRYPRVIEQDKHMLRQAGCHALFYPGVAAIYPQHFQTSVTVEPLGSDLCGRERPGHFQGVATVVTILLNLVRADQAFFGLKDYQQFVIIQRLAQDLNLESKIVGVPTIREPDGLAMSSRNRYLSQEDRQRAAAIHAALAAAKSAFTAGEKRSGRLEAIARRILTEASIHRIQYISVRSATTLLPINTVHTDGVILTAVKVGETRLIDNMLLNLPDQASPSS
ncbi:MAG: pantoate--beta-alanine ligase [Magnetococcales bacterium]|nr:pantoate--beta-alanine ligase [Magnetococcales bacterium]